MSEGSVIMQRKRSSRVALVVLLMGILISCTAVFCQSVPVQECDPLFADMNVPTYVWSKTSQPRAIVFALHGGCMHGRDYDTLASELANRDYKVVSLDMRGYGKWHHEDFGEQRDRTIRYDKTIADITTMLSRLREQYPRTPIYYLGESLGANLSFFLAAKYPQLSDGIIAVNPYVRPNFFLSPRMLLNLGQFAINPPGKINLRPYWRKRLGDDPENVAHHLNDPLGRDCQTVPEMVRSARLNIKGRRVARALQPELPILMVVGGKDKLCSSKASVRFFRKLKSYDKQLVYLKDRGHLLVETKKIPELPGGAIAQWLDEKSQTSIATKNDPEALIRSSLQVKATDRFEDSTAIQQQLVPETY